jgi:cobalt/nickel transport system permease protein
MLTVLPTAAIEPHDAHSSAIDPRARIIAAVALSVTVVAAGRLSVVGLALAAAAVAAIVVGLPLRVAAKRLLPLNVLMLLLVVLLPLTTPGAVVWQLGPLGFSREGLRLAVAVALKGNAVLLLLIVLLGTMDPITLGHAMAHLHVPDKLTHLLLFTVRYLDVLHREYLRLRAAMKARGFRPRMDRQTYRSLGYLVGMLLVRSFDRAERIVAAMKCRGFQGRFFLLNHFVFARRDAVFCTAATALLLVLWLMECGIL